MVNYTELSHKLVSVLRHRAIELGLSIDDKAMVKLNDLLSLDLLKNFTFADIYYVCNNCPKQRLSLEERNGIWFIGANQGHSFKINSDTVLEHITLDKIKQLNIENFIHGTYNSCIDIIKKDGLSRMNRQHIHITTGSMELGEVKSGFRKNCDILVYLDVKQAINDGFKFYISKNGVILTEGNSKGYLPSKYITKVISKSVHQ